MSIYLFTHPKLDCGFHALMWCEIGNHLISLILGDAPLHSDDCVPSKEMLASSMCHFHDKTVIDLVYYATISMDVQ